VDLVAVLAHDYVVELGSAHTDDFRDSRLLAREILDEDLSRAFDFELAEELGEHVLDFVLALHVRAFDEARLCDVEVSSAARADGRDVEVLGDVVSVVVVAVDHFDGPVEVYIYNIRKSELFVNPDF